MKSQQVLVSRARGKATRMTDRRWEGIQVAQIEKEGSLLTKFENVQASHLFNSYQILS